MTGRLRRRLRGAPGASMTPTSFTRKRCRLPPIRDGYRGTQTSKKPSGKCPGTQERKTRKRAQDRDRTKRIEGITGRCQTIKLIAANGTAGTRRGQRETATAVVYRARERRTRRQKKQQSSHVLGRARPWQVRSHSGQPYLWYGIRREAGGEVNGFWEPQRSGRVRERAKGLQITVYT
ncbi:hypothetical protein NDU88_006809 [Pleurodeles waltl]|uniref:Uncharacterized protein n=1 Tax=Pleurodeles waltl TaxID=8319 RepID=A0AAV7NR96_PLEWA|nr:hypothetical protein NDU88_006809 [Pleurodeles waltl]